MQCPGHWQPCCYMVSMSLQWNDMTLGVWPEQGVPEAEAVALRKQFMARADALFPVGRRRRSAAGAGDHPGLDARMREAFYRVWDTLQRMTDTQPRTCRASFESSALFPRRPAACLLGDLQGAAAVCAGQKQIYCCVEYWRPVRLYLGFACSQRIMH